MRTKQCRNCRRKKAIDQFGSNGRGYHKSYCKECDNEFRVERMKRNGEYYAGPETRARYARRRTWILEYHRRRRADPAHRARHIVKDSRASDKRSKLGNEMTIDFVKTLIAKPCSYCAETELLMTLDRINNDLGHVKENVVAACARCNYIRRDMPYSAWLVIVPAIAAARMTGLFGSWSPGPLRNRTASVLDSARGGTTADAPS